MTRRATALHGAAILTATAMLCTGCAVLRPLPASSPPARHPAASSPPAAGAAASPPPATLLPFSPAQLTSAAALADRFAAAYSTWTWRQPPATWLATLTPMAAGQLDGVLAQAAAAPGLLAQRTHAHQTATATASGPRIRDLTPGSVTLTVTVRQVITSTSGSSTTASSLAVTLTPSGDGWQVYDVEPAAAGNTGGE